MGRFRRDLASSFELGGCFHFQQCLVSFTSHAVRSLARPLTRAPSHQPMNSPMKLNAPRSDYTNPESFFTI